jgi:radical SAM protein with 4Fe4S-binding SPASM domain
MRKIFDKVRAYFDRAYFDSSYYKIAYRDIYDAIRVGQMPSAYSHYDRFGRSELRSTARNWLPFISIRTFFAVFTPDKDFLSGLHIAIDPISNASLKFVGFRIDGLKICRIANADIDPEAMLEDGRGYITFASAIARSKGQTYIGIILRFERLKWLPRLTRFVVTPETDFLFSPPTAPTQVPPMICLSPLTQCNLNCIHCISRHTRTKANQLTDEVWNRLGRHVANKQIYHIAADYSGDIIYANGRGKSWLDKYIALDIELRFDTHANDLTPDISAMLMASRLYRVNFSIDSMDPVDYPKIRRGARPLSQVLDNIATFMKLRNDKRPELITIISLVLMRRNLDSIRAAIDFAAEHRISWVVGSHMMVFTSDMTEESVLLDPRRYRATYEDAIAYGASKRVRVVLPAPISNPRPRLGHRPCMVSLQSNVILGNGDVMACCMPGTVVGNLNESSLEEIWNGERVRKFREKVNTSNPPDPCNRCGMFRYENNFESYVPGLPEDERKRFVERVTSLI